MCSTAQWVYVAKEEGIDPENLLVYGTVIITTNKYLHTIQLSDSNTCTFCDRDVETIKHLFWECPVTQRFIQNIDRTLLYIFVLKMYLILGV